MSRREDYRDASDDALVQAAARGDTGAFRALVERWSPRVIAFLTRALGRRADAEDLAQETFLRVYRAAPRYAAEGRFAAWLFRIAGNLARSELRRRKLRGWLLGSTEPEATEALASLPAPRHFDADGPLRDAETRAALAAALVRLPDRQRLAVLLRYYEGLRVRDVAAALGTSEDAAESLLARGIAALRRGLGSQRPDAGGDPPP
jgi:RNA polymerase sigma-70 factor (ECF subfamily)